MVDKLSTIESPIPVCLSFMLRSFIYTLNSRGNKTPPWRTPVVTLKPVDNYDPHLTNITLCLYQ